MNDNTNKDESDNSEIYKYGYTPKNDGDNPANVTPPEDD